MTGSNVGRLAWKEYRLLRGFWVGMLLLCLVIQLALLWMLWGAAPRELPQALFVTAVGMTALYALGCSATAFAAERDNGTYVFQCVLPLQPSNLLLAKLLYAAVSAALLGIVLWGIGYFLLYVHRWSDVGATLVSPPSGVALLGMVKAFELLAWGTFFSLRTARPFRAVAWAAFATALVAYPFSWLLSDIPEQSRGILYFPSFLGDQMTIVPRVIVALVVLAIDVRLVAHWYHASDTLGRSDVEEAPRAVRTRALQQRSILPSSWQRLFWQLLVRSHWTIISIAIVYFGVLLVLATFPPSQPAGVQWLVASLLAVCLLGAFVFAEDQQQRQYRFFAEHGVSSRTVWWTRQVFWGLLMLAVLLTSTAALVTWYGSLPTTGRMVSVMWAMALSIYATAQLCSQRIRNLLVAAPVACASSLLLCAWIGLMALGRVSFWGSVAPIPVLLLWAGWLTASDWITDRHGRLATVRKVLPLAAAAVMVVSYAIYHRWTEIPLVAVELPQASRSAEQMAEDAETIRLYEQAWTTVQRSGRLPSPSVTHQYHVRPDDWSEERMPQDLYSIRVSAENRDWLEGHDHLVDLAMQLSRRKFVSPLATSAQITEGPNLAADAAWELRGLVLESAYMQKEDGNLDESLDQYLAALRIETHCQQLRSPRWSAIGLVSFFSGEPQLGILIWAHQAGQSSPRIRRAIDALTDYKQQESELSSERILRRYRWQTEFLQDPLHVNDPESSIPRLERWCLWLLPWERARAERLAGLNTMITTKIIATKDRSITGDDATRVSELDDILGPYDDLEWMHWMRSTSQLRGEPRPSWTRDVILSNMQDQRGILLALTLEGWRCNHADQLPETLEELVPDWLEMIPLDPFTGEPFEYYSHGIPTELSPFSSSSYAGLGGLALTIPPHTPLLRSNYERRRMVIAFPARAAQEDKQIR